MVASSEEVIFHTWYFTDRDCLVRVPDEVLELMRRRAAKAAPRETGGTLVGHYSKDNREAVVTKALESMTGARKSRTRFYRPPDDVDGQLARVYEGSGGRIHYLGEWHTHPGGAPSPSTTDLNTLQGLARSRSVATDTPFMVILGSDICGTTSVSCTLFEKDGCTLYGSYEQVTVREMEALQ
jgi:integrative and conjugative element protein (TIGR02256 family)